MLVHWVVLVVWQPGGAAKSIRCPGYVVFFVDVYFSALSDFWHCLCFKRIGRKVWYGFRAALEKGKGAESVL